jgi:hypothetical protein
MTYQPGIPTGSVPLNQDYLNLQANFTQINDQFEVDHVPLTSTSGTPPNGYHEAIHLVPVSTPTSNPPNNQPINGYTATTGYGQVFDATINDGINVDQALFFLTGGNRLMQLTRNFVPVSASRGYTFLPGGLILQWGVINSPGISGTVTFSSSGGIAFPSNIFNVQITQRRDGSNSTQGMYVNGNPTRTQFSYNGSTSTDDAIFWTAIGN